MYVYYIKEKRAIKRIKILIKMKYKENVVSESLLKDCANIL